VGTALVPAAQAGVKSWEVNEIVAAVDGDPAVRFVELKNVPGGCLFPSSRIEILDGAGALIGVVVPVTATTCFEAGWHWLFATPEAEAALGVPADAPLYWPLPAGAGQVCFVSSTTRYDCARWGTVTVPATDFFGAEDTTSALAIPDGVALARIATTHVVAVDFALQTPTPRQPNDGTPWFPPDAGPTPDAAPRPDAAPTPDAAPPADARVDAAPRADAGDDAYLDVHPVGGATCACRVGRPARGPADAAPFLALALVLVLRRRARS
jgi:hypothetical protein